MEERYRNARDLSETVTRNSLNHIVTEIDFSKLDDREIGLVIFNSSPEVRSEVVTFSVDIPVSWDVRYIAGTKYKNPIMVDVFDSAGEKVPCQLIAMEEEDVYAYLKYGSAFNYEATRMTLAIDAKDLPAMGYACYSIRPKFGSDRPIEFLSPKPNILENEFLRAEIQSDGTITLVDKQTDRTFTGLHYFEDGGDMGGPLIHDMPNGNAIYTTKGDSASVAMVHSGPLYAQYRIEHTWMLPENLVSDIKVHVPHGREWVEHGALKRSVEKVPLRITTDVILRKDSRKLEFATTFENTIEDHRLRVVFPTDLSEAQYCHVDSPFDVPERAIAIPDSSDWYEKAAATLPSHSFVDVSDGTVGLAVMHCGIPEYEVVDNDTRSIALTLIRAFATSGNPSETWIPQPLAQCPGTHTFNYAVMPHSKDWSQGDALDETNRFNTPVRVAQCTRHAGTMSSTHSFLQVEGKGFVVSALKKAEEDDAVILRGFNPTKETINVTVTLPVNVEHAEKVSLEEVKMEDLKIAGKKQFVFEAKPGEIASVAIYL